MRKLALNDEILLKIEKPARYIGNEVNSVMKDPEKVDIRFAMCFPDVYEIGMSHLGIQILYDMFNQREDVWCERVYSPWLDLHKIMKEEQIPLFALESQDPIRDFDFLGITIQYEMCYTNILQILDLSRIPHHSRDRGEADPIVIGGGPCTYNPEPLAEFFDIFYIGEGETVYDELLDAYKEYRAAGKSRLEFLERAAQIEGLYVPMFYDAAYHEDGTLASFTPNNEHAPSVIKKTNGTGCNRSTVSTGSSRSFHQSNTGSCRFGNSERMYPRMPFLSGRHAVSSDQRAQCGALEAIRQSNAGKHRTRRDFFKLLKLQ